MELFHAVLLKLILSSCEKLGSIQASLLCGRRLPRRIFFLSMQLQAIMAGFAALPGNHTVLGFAIWIFVFIKGK